MRGLRLAERVPLVHHVTCGFVSRFERLDLDLHEVCRRVGIAERPRPRLNAGPLASTDLSARAPRAELQTTTVL